MIRWFAKNGIAANILFIAVLVAGVYTALFRVPLEITPALSWNTIEIQVPYRGGTAQDVQRAVLIPIEQSLEGLPGVKHIEARGYRGQGRVRVEADESANLRDLMDEVKARVDTITTFPAETERPRIYIPDSASRYEVLSVAVSGNLNESNLLDLAQKVNNDLLEIPGISQTDLRGERVREISIEVDSDKLLAYSLTFADIATAIRQFSIDLPAGAIDTDAGSFVVRTKGQAYTAREYAAIPLRSAGGADLSIGDVATVVDGFEEGDKQILFNDKPALFIEVMRTGNESAIDISDKVHRYVEESRRAFPAGVDLAIWDDESPAIRGRLQTLLSSIAQGAVLVLIVLGLFLRPALAFWIVIGIPFGFAGAVLLMPSMGITANAMSLFGFIIVVGIVVDDAIVTAENVYGKIREGMPPLEAAVEGAHEVATPVTFGALTTMVAFVPLLFFDGSWGDFAKQIPPVVAPVLLFSLIESKLILPSHLKHLSRIETAKGFGRVQHAVARGLEGFIDRIYRPTLELAIRYRMMVLAVFAAGALAMTGYCLGGRMGFVSFPSVDRQRISAMLDMPDNTSLETTGRYVERIDQAVDQLRTEFVDPGSGRSLILNVAKAVGARHPGSYYDKSKGYLSVEILSPDLRSEPGPKNSEIAARLTEIVGPIPEAVSFRTYAESTLDRGDDYENEHLNLELRGPASAEKAAVAERIREMLESYDGVSTAWANVDYGQDELELTLKDRAAELGLNQQMLAQQIRQAFFGEEAQRIQRGIDDIRVMVRLPEKERRTLHTLEQMLIRTPRGANVPLMTVADIDFNKQSSYVERNDRAEIIRCGAQPIDETVNVLGIAKDIAPKIDQLCRANNLSYQFVGYVAEAEENRWQTIIMASLLMLTLYGMLTIPLNSLLQPFFVLLAVPFAVIGALLGHIYMDMTPSYLSIFGMLALAGVAVNDTLVMIDYINSRRLAGEDLAVAAAAAGVKRFRPIVLTSVTTFVGLLPLMMDRSLQAQLLIPMAVSLAFGVLFATVVTLYLIPCAVLATADLSRHLGYGWTWYFRPVTSGRETASVETT